VSNNVTDLVNITLCKEQL